jgi:hypothetical protein
MINLFLGILWVMMAGINILLYRKEKGKLLLAQVFINILLSINYFVLVFK